MSFETVYHFGSISFHRAPELIYPEMFGLCTSRISKQADIYAFGMVIYEVLTRRCPFGAEGFSYLQIASHVLGGGRPRKPEKVGDIGFGGGTWELVQQCWHRDRGERPTVENVSEYFQRVAGTSSTVPPGSTIPDFETEAPVASKLDRFSRDFGWCPLQLTPNGQVSSLTPFTARLFVSTSQRDTSIVQ